MMRRPFLILAVLVSLFSGVQIWNFERKAESIIESYKNRTVSLEDTIRVRGGVWQTLQTLCSQTPGGACTVGYKQYPDPDRPGEKFTQLFFKTVDGRCFLFDPFGEKIEDCKVLTALVSP